MTEIESFSLQWWGIVWLAELILRYSLWHCFGELRCSYRCGMKVSKTATKICKAMLFLENTAGQNTYLWYCQETTLWKLWLHNISKNGSSDNIGNIAKYRMLMLPVMFACITLKYTNQTVYSATCSSALYTRRKLDRQRMFQRSSGRFLNVLFTFNLHKFTCISTFNLHV